MANDAGSEDLEQRVSTLEVEVARLREQTALAQTDAEAARVLASGADRDVSEVRAELRAHTSALNALRETQIDDGRRIDGLTAEVRMGFSELRSEMRAGTSTITGLLGTLIEDDKR